MHDKPNSAKNLKTVTPATELHIGRVANSFPQQTFDFIEQQDRRHVDLVIFRLQHVALGEESLQLPSQILGSVVEQVISENATTEMQIGTSQFGGAFPGALVAHGRAMGGEATVFGGPTTAARGHQARQHLLGKQPGQRVEFGVVFDGIADVRRVRSTQEEGARVIVGVNMGDKFQDADADFSAIRPRRKAPKMALGEEEIERRRKGEERR